VLKIGAPTNVPKLSKMEVVYFRQKVVGAVLEGFYN